MATGPLEVTLKVEGMPEYMYAMRKALADVLREVAADEPPEVAARMRHAADLFQMGIAPEAE
jgi:hypothetical protein